MDNLGVVYSKLKWKNKLGHISINIESIVVQDLSSQHSILFWFQEWMGLETHTLE